MLVLSPANISYLTGFLSRDAHLLVSSKKNIYFTDSRYIQAVRKSLKGCLLKEADSNGFKHFMEAFYKLGFKRLGFEKEHLSLALYQKLRRESAGRGITLIPVCGIIEEFRQIKNEDELEKIRFACGIAIKALRNIKDFIAPGKREIEVAGELERYLRYAGASRASFDIIVASGPNSSLPHHITGSRKIRDNEPVLVDVGADYLGYKSDLTRVFFSGRINTLYRKIQDIVHKARDLAVQEIKPGKIARDIDFLARSFIAEKGYGKYFFHSLGHGIGLEVHEGLSLSPKSDNILKSGMVLTVEPAIYLPDKFGSRVEEMVLVTRKGCEVLSGALDK